MNVTFLLPKSASYFFSLGTLNCISPWTTLSQPLCTLYLVFILCGTSSVTFLFGEHLFILYSSMTQTADFSLTSLTSIHGCLHFFLSFGSAMRAMRDLTWPSISSRSDLKMNHRMTFASLAFITRRYLRIVYKMLSNEEDRIASIV